MKTYILLDRSGSMNHNNLWAESIGGINAYVEALKDNSDIYVAMFDNVSFDVIRSKKFGPWTPIDKNEGSPRGMTPLYDAMGQLLDIISKDNPEKAVVVVVTDGAENCSTEYTKTTIAARLEDAKKLGREFIFLGANFDSIQEETAQFGYASNRSVYTKGVLLGDTMRMVASKATMYAQGVNASALDFTDAEIATASGQILPAVPGVAPVWSASPSDMPVATPVVTPVTKTKRSTKKKDNNV